MRLSDKINILRFRRLLEVHSLNAQMLATIDATLSAGGLMLITDSVVNANLIAAPSSAKNSTGKSYPKMHQTKKSNQWHLGKS
jgi:transposase, IS5 family